MSAIKETELFRVMKESGSYIDDDDIVDVIEAMREEVAEGEDPTDVLESEGFALDYVLDLLS